MKKKLGVIASLVAASALVAGSAGAAGVVAGWDFSQYRGHGSLAPFTNTLPANYSDFDPTFNSGSGSAAFGTLYFDGTNGSSSTLTNFLPTAGAMNCERRPVGGPLRPAGCAVPNVDGPVRSNKNEPWSAPGDVSFDAHSVLRSEGQQHQNLLAMTASNNVSVVFEGDVGAPIPSSTWSVSFGARTISGVGDDGGPLTCDPAGASECTANISVEYSTNGVTYTSFGSVPISSDDSRYNVQLATNTSPTGFVRLGLAPGAGGAQPVIDNVALPEPGSTMMLLAGALGVLALRRLRG